MEATACFTSQVVCLTPDPVNIYGSILPILASLSTTARLSSTAHQKARLSTHQLVDLSGWVFGVGIGAEAQILCSEDSQDFVPSVHCIEVEYRCIILYVSGITIQYSRQEYATPLETGWI
jgi:hypothetical protein